METDRQYNDLRTARASKRGRRHRAAGATLLLPAVLALARPSQARLFRHPQRADCVPSFIAPRDIRGFHQVDRDLYRGGHPSCRGYAQLQALGIRTFIDLQGGLEKNFERCAAQTGGAPNRYRFVPFKINLLQTTLTGVPDQRLRSLFALMAKAPKPIFINCKFGEDRTGLVVALYRLKLGEMTYAEARREALYYGFETHLCGLNRTLKRYRNPRELMALPQPGVSAPPLSSVCRPQGFAP